MNALMRSLGTLRAIRRYPIKSLRGEDLREIAVLDDGLPGDRIAAPFVRSGHARAGKTLRGKEHDRLHLLSTADEARAAAAERGIDIEIRSEDTHYFDDAPISLIFDRWLDGVSAQMGYRVRFERFRPNFYVSADEKFDETERSLDGARLQLGDGVRLRVRYGIERCVVPTYDPETGEADPRILRYIAQQRQNIMGIYCDVEIEGIVRIGDPVTLLR